jgi:glutamate:GABA antiporter
LLEPTINGFYWFLTALSTELYMLMYILMFCAGIKLHYSYVNRPKSFKIPGNNLGMWIISLLGLAGCLVTILVSFFPPGNVDIGSPLRYLYMIIAGNILTISPIFLFYLYQKRKQAL